jgi:hypothetical protein
MEENLKQSVGKRILTLNTIGKLEKQGIILTYNDLV